MKKFLLKLLAFAVALALPFAGYFAVQQSKPSVYAGSMMGCLQTKIRTLQDTPGARVLIVGGSGAPYGVICGAVEDAFGMPCLNLGGTAYVGIRYYFQMLRGNLHPGDVVVLVPEFSLYMDVYSYTTVWMTVESDALAQKAVPLSYWPGMAANYYNYVVARNGMLAAHGAPAGDRQAQYEHFGFGPHGDLTFERAGELDLETSLADALAIGADTLDAGVLAAMNDFYRYAQSQGATVVLSYAPFCEDAALTGRDGLAEFAAALQAGCDVPVISDLGRTLWPRALFYNTNNHLASAGMRLRTAELIEDLGKVL